MKSFIFLFAITLFSCHIDDEEIDTSIPTCIQSILDDSTQSSDLKTIRVQKLNGQYHYWLNTDFTQFDGVETIVNSDCEQVCFFCGECHISDCAQKYKADWVVIWTK